MNEDKFLQSIFPKLKQGSDIVVGPGDDCAVIDINDKDRYYLIAVDQIISGIHFDPNITTPEEAGAKLIKRNISDIAAMGGEPAHAVLTISSNKFNNKWLDFFYNGLTKEANKWNVSICGGDIASMPSCQLAVSSKQSSVNSKQLLVTTLTITGYVNKNKLCLRKNAKVGDVIFVTGKFGYSYKSKHHLNFEPRVNEAKFLSGSYTNTMIDVSDGLLMDLYRVSLASNVSIQINTDTIPYRTKKITERNILTDGEDYELIFTVEATKVDSLIKNWPFETKLTQIGNVINIKATNNKVKITDFESIDLLEKYKNPGWDHLD